MLNTDKKEKKKTIKDSIIKEIYKKRPKSSHKDQFGRLLVVGGNKTFSGSPGFNSLTALQISSSLQSLTAYRSGVDIVEVVAPERPANIIASYSPDLITYPLKGDYLGEKPNHLKKILEEADNKSAFVIGGGIGKKPKTLQLVRDFLEKTSLLGVVDADAIHAFKSLSNDKKEPSSMDLTKLVFTPHEFEFYILTGKKIPKSASLKEKINIVEKEAKRLNTTILLKGPEDIISGFSSSEERKTRINKTGTPYMTVGGTGDILAGLIGTLLAQNIGPLKSASAGAYITGKAAEITYRKESLMASDLIEEIGNVVDNKR